MKQIIIKDLFEKLKEENIEKQVIIKDLSNNIDDLTKKYNIHKKLFESQETQETNEN